MYKILFHKIKDERGFDSEEEYQEFFSREGEKLRFSDIHYANCYLHKHLTGEHFAMYDYIIVPDDDFEEEL